MQQANASIIGLGLYELHLNDQRVGNQVLALNPTDYTQGVKYNTFDVTALPRLTLMLSARCSARAA